ncbi:MAG: hypothetical protein OXD54_04330 [Candidatus Poribacteria bacterium]|nr:hypothetical protein [Candidatus Poribacteria bacterium]
MTRRKILFISISLFILLCGIGGYFFISSDYFLENYIRERLITALEDQINEDYEVKIQKLRGNVLTGVVVDDFSIVDTKSTELPILSTEQIILRYNILGLLRRKFLVTEFEIEGPKVVVVRQSDGQVNLMHLLQKPESDSATESDNDFAFAISNFKVNGGEIYFVDKEKQFEVSIPEIEVKLSGKLDKWDHSGSFSIGKGNITLNGVEMPIERIHGVKFALATNSEELQPLQLQIGNSLIVVNQYKRNWSTGLWNAGLQITFDAADVQYFLDEQTQLAGVGKVTLDFSGTDSTLQGNLTVTSEALTVQHNIGASTDNSEFKSRKIEITDLNINTILNLDSEPNVILEKINMHIAGGTLSGNGKVLLDSSIQGNLFDRLQQFFKYPIKYESNLQISDMELNSLLSMLVEIPKDAPQVKSGILNGTAQINGGAEGEFHLESNIELSESSLQANGQTEPVLLKDSSLNCNINLEENIGSTITVNGMLDDAIVEMNGSLEQVELRIDNFDFGKICDIVNTVPFVGIGSITAQIKKDWTATGYVEIPETSYGDFMTPISLGVLTGYFRYSDKIVYIENAHLVKKGEVGETKVSIEGNVKLADKLPATFNIVSDPLVLDSDYNRLFFQQELPIQGVINGELNLYGFLIDHLDGKGLFSIESGNAWEINIDPVMMSLEIDDYSLTIPNFEITTRNQLVIFNAHVTNEGAFNFSLKNEVGKPIRLAEVALAADITDFPLDGKLDIHVDSYQKLNEDFVFKVDFDFSDLTFDGNPLGDATMFATLVEGNKHTEELDYFKFTGEAFEGTGRIDGKIFNIKDNPYQFTLQCDGISVTPILRIFDKRLETISGSADGNVKVEGTLTDLTPNSVDPNNKPIHPYDVEITINNTQLQYKTVNFTNPKPIFMLLENDILTIADSSLTVVGEKTSFVNLNGSLNLKNEKVDISANSDDNIVLAHLGEVFDIPISGSGYYQLKWTGTISDPNVELGWRIPSLVVDTKLGDISFSNTNGQLTYQNHVLSIKPFKLNLMDNSVQVGGTVSVNQNDLYRSRLNIDIISDYLDLAQFSNIVKNALSEDALDQFMLGDTTFLQGVQDVTVNLNGSFLETNINLNAHTIDNYPIKLGMLTEPITLKQFQALTTINKNSVNIQELVINGNIGQGSVQITGETSISTQERDDIMYDFDVSFQKLKVDDFVRFISQDQSFLTGTLGGSVTLKGKGIKSELISAKCKIDEMDLYTQDFHIFNNSRIDFNLENNNVNSHFPIQITSPIIETAVDARIGGTLTSPTVEVLQQGKIKHSQQNEIDMPLELHSNIQYTEKQIKLEIKLTDNENDLTLAGIIPFDMTLSDKKFVERFIDVPTNITLSGNELPLTFFPWLNNVISEVEGVSDINLALTGTLPKLHLQGNVYVHAPHLRNKNIPQIFKNVIIQIQAGKHNNGEDVIELTEFQFDLDEGEVSLLPFQHSQLILDGLTPKRLEINGLKLKEYPLGSLLQQNISSNLIQDIEGTVNATLEKLIIPFESFFENGDRIPLPKISKLLTFDAVSQNSYADLRIDNFSCGFTALGQLFRFVNPSSIPINLNNGEFTVSELKLQNTVANKADESILPMVISSYGRWNMRGKMLLNFKLTNFDLSICDPLFSEANLDTYKLRGLVSTGINITGTYAEPNITVSFEGDNLSLNQAKIDEFNGAINYNSGSKQWLIEESNPLLLKSGGNQLTCSGYIPYLISFSNMQVEPVMDPMEVKCTLTMDELGMLSDIEPTFESVQGDGSVTATIFGTLDEPQLTGIGEFNALSFSIKGSPISISETDVQIELTESQLQIVSIFGELNDGNFFASGYLHSDWFSFNYLDLNVSMDNCSFVEPGQYNATLSTGDNNLHLYGNLDESIQSNLTISGDIIIHSGDYEQNWESVQEWFSGATVSQVELAVGNTILNNLQLDVGIEIPDNIRFISSLGGSTVIKINGSGRLTGLIQEPIFVGDIYLLEGRISTVTQIFEIVPGSSIRNHNPREFNPDLNIILRLPNPIRGVLLEDGGTTDVNVRLTITGTLQNNKPTYISELLNSSTAETLTEAEVLALLLPGNSISRSIGGITFTVSSGFDPEERHIIAIYPLPNNMSIKVEGDEKGDFGVDIQLLERRF